MNEPTFKNICLMHIQQLTNFPYIEKDFDALTDYGLLCAVVEKLNEVIENQNTTNNTVIELYNAFVTLKEYIDNYFDNLDVQDEINNKLEEMAQSGELTALIKNYIDPIQQSFETQINDTVTTQNNKITVLESRMDTFSSLPDGSTSGDAELQDIRVASNGVTYATAGDSVRGQINNVYNTIDDNFNNKNFNNLINTNYWIGSGSANAGKGGDNTSIVVNTSTLSGKLIISTLTTQTRYRIGLCTSEQFEALTGTPTTIEYSELHDNTNHTIIVDITDNDYLIVNVTDITKVSINKDYNYATDYKNINENLITRYGGTIFHHGKLGVSYLQEDGYYNIGDANGYTSNPIEVIEGDKIILNNLVYGANSNNIFALFTDDKGYVISYLITTNEIFNNKYMELTVPAKATRVYIGCGIDANLDQITITRITKKINDNINKFETKPNYFILDTDLCTDVDDVMALRIVSWAERNNIINLLGLILSCNGTQIVNGTTYYSKICADALFQYDGLNNVKMGCFKSISKTSRYYSDITNNFYHTLTGTNNGLSASTNVYRRMLASIPDGRKCTIAIVGYLTAFSDLLNTTSDAYSSLTGLELVQAKVDKVYIMGGTYPQSTIIETNFSYVDATNNVLTNCPVPMIFLGNEWEVIQAGQSLITDNKTYDPVYVALHEYWTSRDGHDSIKPRMAWDPLTTLLAIIGNEAMGMGLVKGTNSINTDLTSPSYGYNTFTPSENGKDYYVTKRYNNKFYQDSINDILDRKSWLNKKNS